MFILMISFAILIWIASGDNSADPSLLAEVCAYTYIYYTLIYILCSYKLTSCVGVCRYFRFNNPNHRRRNMFLW